MRTRVLVVLLLLVVPSAAAVASASAAGTWAWPVSGPVIRGFDPPDSPYGSGHRGIDIAAPAGSVVLAPADGRVAFAGPVGGRLFLTIDHSGGLESTYSWVASPDTAASDHSRNLFRSSTGTPRSSAITVMGSGNA